jgi:hypothetical protein
MWLSLAALAVRDFLIIVRMVQVLRLEVVQLYPGKYLCHSKGIIKKS